MSIAALNEPPVRLETDRVVFDNFIETDRHVLEASSSCADPEVFAHKVLGLGVRLSALAAGTGGLTELEARVGTRLEVLTGEATQTVQSGLESLAKQTRALFAAEDGELTRFLAAWRGEFDRSLGEAFDPGRKASVVAAFERVLAEVLETYGRRLVLSSDPDIPDSPAGRLMAQVRANGAEIKTELAALSLAVGADRGRSTEYERTAVKGLDFEPLVLEVVTGISSPYGDLVENVGRTQGTKGRKKGDILVTLDDEDGTLARYVIEAKNRRLSLDGTWRELDQAMANWEALAAIAVFAAGDSAPTDLPFFYSGNRAIVVLDRNDGDTSALALACLFARWVVRRQALAPTGSPDPARITAAIERAQRALARVTTIRRLLATSTKATSDARSQLDELADETKDALAELAAEVGR